MERCLYHREYALNDSRLFPHAVTCSICNCIRRLFIEADVEIDLGDHKWGGQDLPCEMHEGLLSWFSSTFYERSRYFASQGRWFPPDEGKNTIGFSRSFGAMPEIRMLCRKGEKVFIWSLGLLWVGLPPTSQPNSTEEPFNPDWVNLQVARKWLSSCVRNHGSNCGDTLDAFTCTPAYLIDTEHSCIVRGGSTAEYVALSYRWGDPGTSFRTKKGNLANLTIPGSILKQTNIPHTIIHAMEVVRALGDRYLWVDSLCIVSDDRKQLQEQLQIMGSIYMSAKLTIISTDGNAWEGLHGIQNVSQPRQLPNAFPWLEGTKLVVRDLPAFSSVPSAYSYYSNSKYYQRGWTFQEYMLSRRRLIFGNRLIHWKCGCAMFHEDQPNKEHHPESSSGMPSNITVSKILTEAPDFDEFGKLANDYHRRVFTYPEDALPGITGLLNLLKHSFTGGFVFGLPVVRFDAALMWYCGLDGDFRRGYAGGTSLEARTPSMGQSADLPGATLPSWSWVSWRGRNLRVLFQEENYQLYDARWHFILSRDDRYVTTPFTKWFCHETPFSSERWHILSFSDNENSRDLKFVDQGWIEQPLDPLKHHGHDRVGLDHQRKELEAAAGKLVYRHPHYPNKVFWRPFTEPPFEQQDSRPEACKMQRCQYISCRTQRNWFYARRLACETDVTGLRKAEPKDIEEVSFHAQLVVVNNSNQVCGWLQVPGEPSATDFTDGSSKLVRLGEKNPAFEDASSTNDGPHTRPKVELVVICCRQRSNLYRRDETVKQFYGVLLVTWKDKVAYRRGCGFIDKQMWDQSGAEEVDLVLG